MCGCSGGATSTTQRRTAPTNRATPRMGRALNDAPIVAPGIQLPGDVLVTVLFSRGSPSTKSGRAYGWMENGEQWWISPADLDAHPNWFALVEAVPA